MFYSLLTVALLGFAAAQTGEHETKPELTVDVIPPKQGDICNVNQDLQPAQFDNQFFECLVPTHGSEWIWPQLGVWVVKNCSDGYLFSAALSACKESTTVRRQQACGPQGCGQQFLIQPQPFTGGCGAGGCGFQPQQQIIYQPESAYQPEPVYQPQPYYQPQGQCPQAQIPVGSCGGQQQCPGYSTCHQPTTTCCQPQVPVQPIQPVYPEPQCPQPQIPVGTCGVQQQCPGVSTCHPQTNTCCQQPQPVQPVYPPQPVQPVYPVYPEPQCPQPQVPVGSCGAQQQCPGVATCQPQTNTCCQQPQPVQPVYPVQPPMPAPCGVPGPNPCPTPCGQPQCPQPVVKRPCPQSSGCGGQTGGSCGGYCSWMIDPLRPGQGNGYMQCVPVPNPVSEYCGQWRPRKCGYGSKFNPRAQVCIRDPSVRPRPGPQCPQTQIPIGTCNAQQQCPGYSTCQQQTNTCCQQAQFSG